MRTYSELKSLIEQRGVHPVFGDAGEGFNIEQNSHELATFLVAMQGLGVTSCLEIGTGYRGGLSRFLAADMGWEVYSYDIENYGLSYPGVTYAYPPLTFGYLRVDLVFIDGDHRYEWVKHDYTKWQPYAEKVVAFHDVLGLRDCEGVGQFWREMKRRLHWPSEYVEIVDTGDRASGIGYIDVSEPDEQEYDDAPERTWDDH